MHIPGLLLANSTRAMDQALEQATGGGAPQPAESTADHQASSSKGVVYRAVEQARAGGAPAGAIEHVKTPVTVASRCSSCCTVFPDADRCMLCMGCKLMFCNRCIGAHKRAGPCRPCRQQAHAVGPVAKAMRIKAMPIGQCLGMPASPAWGRSDVVLRILSFLGDTSHEQTLLKNIARSRDAAEMMLSREYKRVCETFFAYDHVRRIRDGQFGLHGLDYHRGSQGLFRRAIRDSSHSAPKVLRAFLRNHLAPLCAVGAASTNLRAQLKFLGEVPFGSLQKLHKARRFANENLPLRDENWHAENFGCYVLLCDENWRKCVPPEPHTLAVLGALRFKVERAYSTFRMYVEAFDKDLVDMCRYGTLAKRRLRHIAVSPATQP